MYDLKSFTQLPNIPRTRDRLYTLNEDRVGYTFFVHIQASLIVRTSQRQILLRECFLKFILFVNCNE